TRLQGYGLSATEALAAVRGQNVQFAAGALGGDPAPQGQGFTAMVSAESRFSTVEEFENIILRANPDGTTVRLKDVARIALGASTYGFETRFQGQPAGAFALMLQPGANALNVAEAVRSKMDELQPSFPQGVN